MTEDRIYRLLEKLGDYVAPGFGYSGFPCRYRRSGSDSPNCILEVEEGSWEVHRTYSHRSIVYYSVYESHKTYEVRSGDQVLESIRVPSDLPFTVEKQAGP